MLGTKALSVIPLPAVHKAVVKEISTAIYGELSK